jgi:hypothetical protein
MSRKVFLIPLLATAFLAAPAFAPAALPGLSASAQAAISLNSSRSNIYRTKKATPKANARRTTAKRSKANTSVRARASYNTTRSNIQTLRTNTVKSTKYKTGAYATTCCTNSSKSNSDERVNPKSKPRSY